MSLIKKNDLTLVSGARQQRNNAYVGMEKAFRVSLVFAVFLLTLLWFWLLFFFPDGLNDKHGTTHVVFLVIVSAWHLPLACLLVVASFFRLIRWPIAVFVLLTPVVHFIAAPYEPPLCIVLFIAPSIASLTAGTVELFGKSRKR